MSTLAFLRLPFVLRRGTERASFALCSALLTLTAVFPTAWAQQAQEQEVVTRAEVKKLRVLYRETPRFADEDSGIDNQRDWLRVLVEYETAVSAGGYTDELKLAWSLAIITAEDAPVVMKREITYLDVPAGEHYAVVYVRPGFLERYYGNDSVRQKDLKVYLEIRNKGKVVRPFHYPEERPAQLWWTLAEPRIRRMDGELLTRLETPFKSLEYDAYEYIKPERYD